MPAIASNLPPAMHPDPDQQPPPAPAPPACRLIRMDELQTAVGLRRSTIYQLIARGDFPRGVHITARCVAWPSTAVDEWVRRRIQTGQAHAG